MSVAAKQVEPVQLRAIKTDERWYVQIASAGYYDNYRINDESLVSDSWTEGWWTIQSEPKSVTKKRCRPPINHRWEIADLKGVSELTPAVLPQDAIKVETQEDDDEDRTIVVYSGSHAAYRALYKQVSDPQDPVWEPVEFKLDVIADIPNLERYRIDPPWHTIKKGSWNDKSSEIGESAINHYLLDLILFPEILVRTRPCFLTGEQMYEIIRGHVLTHIDSAVAFVDSNYDFHFSVRKRIELTSPYNRVFEEKKGRRKVQVTRAIKHRDVQVLNLKPREQERYGGSVPPKMEGRDYEDLKNKVDKLLSELMRYINTPVKECPHCQGSGIEDENFKFEV